MTDGVGASDTERPASAHTATAASAISPPAVHGSQVGVRRLPPPFDGGVAPAYVGGVGGYGGTAGGTGGALRPASLDWLSGAGVAFEGGGSEGVGTPERRPSSFASFSDRGPEGGWLTGEFQASW